MGGGMSPDLKIGSPLWGRAQKFKMVGSPFRPPKTKNPNKLNTFKCLIILKIKTFESLIIASFPAFFISFTNKI
jgi:hypothetical protein